MTLHETRPVDPPIRVESSLTPLLAPQSVVVIGAGRSPGGVGRAVVENLKAKHFLGPMAAVNHHAVPDEVIAGACTYLSISDVPWQPDLAVIAVPAASVAGVLEECGAAGVRAVVVLSAGFAEAGNIDGQAELVQIAHRHGMRLLGPNCLGVLNTDPEIQLDATFARTTPRAAEHGGVALAAQSGALGISVLDAAWQRGIGISGFVSLGNKADVSGNDVLSYWADDPRTTVIALYLESIGNPRRFRQIATEVARVKPIVALRSGRSAAGARAGASHTAATATPDAATRALLRDAGVIEAGSTQELIDIAMLLNSQPVPAGRRLVIIGNAGGPGALAADAGQDAGAILPELCAATRARLKAVVGAATGLQNPVYLGDTATGADYAAALAVLRASGEADALVIVHVATGAQPTQNVIQAVEQAELDAGRDVPGAKPPSRVTVAAALIGAPPPRDGVLPWFGFAESAARAVARAADLGAWRAQTATVQTATVQTATVQVRLAAAAGMPIPADIDVAAVTAFLQTAPCSVDGWLLGDGAARLLELIGIPVCPTASVHGAEAAVQAAAAIEGPVVVKSAAAGLSHKSELGAVVVGVRGAEQVRRAARRIGAAIGWDDLLVQPLVPAGLELLLGVSLPSGGVPVVMVAAGGIHEEVHDDHVLRTLPLALGGAEQMLAQLRCAPMLSGHRGSPVLDRAAVAQALARIALLDVIAPQIRELDINPLIVGENGAIAVDAKARLAVARERTERPFGG